MRKKKIYLKPSRAEKKTTIPHVDSILSDLEMVRKCTKSGYLMKVNSLKFSLVLPIRGHKQKENFREDKCIIKMRN